MSRSARLLDLIQLLRTYRRPVSGQALADGLGISLRTLYRDIATLQAQGADIQGAPGFGYILKPGFLLPPIMLGETEIEALVLGARWVAQRADDDLKTAARNALAKIAAVLPADLRRELEGNTLLVGPGKPRERAGTDMATLRQSVRAGLKLDITYVDEAARTSARRIWPVALGYFDDSGLLIAWCELRDDFRHFRADRIVSLATTDCPLPQKRIQLLRRWRDRNGIPDET